jgi:hypothetical protein
VGVRPPLGHAPVYSGLICATVPTRTYMQMSPHATMHTMSRCIAQSDTYIRMYAHRSRAPIYAHMLVVRNAIPRVRPAVGSIATPRDLPQYPPPGYTKIDPGRKPDTYVYILPDLCSPATMHIYVSTASCVHIHTCPCSRANTCRGIHTHISCVPECCRRPTYIIIYSSEERCQHMSRNMYAYDVRN